MSVLKNKIKKDRKEEEKKNEEETTPNLVSGKKICNSWIYSSTEEEEEEVEVCFCVFSLPFYLGGWFIAWFARDVKEETSPRVLSVGITFW